jgi:hypothetical protein
MEAQAAKQAGASDRGKDVTALKTGVLFKK